MIKVSKRERIDRFNAEDNSSNLVEMYARERLAQLRKQQPFVYRPPNGGFSTESVIVEKPTEKNPPIPAVDMLGPLTRKITFEDEK